ncbi:MAG TPA: hypothetical protein VN621_06275 [Arthrobacter sp.]|nr:hypothetical protein [Arthrobacter sp.]
MDTLPEPTTRNARRHTQRPAWIGYALGIACMAVLFIAGLAAGKPQLTVMASSLAVLLGAVWSSTSAAVKKSAGRGNPAGRKA